MAKSGRNVDGILLLNKPVGISSNGALQRVKRLFGARKAGHTGSLDNLASGLLPICLGEATKLAGFLLQADKYYQAEFTLGVTTETGDAEGSVLQTRALTGINRDKIDAVIEAFTGPIQQVPPMYSALKHKGQALYKLARKGKTVERAARSVTIYALTVQQWEVNRLSVEVHCSKGTYIRTLAEDIGEALGCGAYTSALHRIGVGDFTDMYSIETLESKATTNDCPYPLDSLLIPMYTALNNWQEVYLSPKDAYHVRQGQSVQIPQILANGLVKLFIDNGNHIPLPNEFIGIGQVQDDGRIAPKRLIKNGE